MKDFRGKIICWNRKSTAPYFGVIIDSELRDSSNKTAPWLWHRIEWTTPTSPEFKDTWVRCDHVNVISGFEMISQIHKAMTVAESVKA